MSSAQDQIKGGSRATTVSQLHSRFASIQGELKRVLDGINEGKILSSFEILSKITDAVVVSCEALGLASEQPVVETFHRDNFWRALNQCWLVALQNVSAAGTDEERLREEHIVHLKESVVQWGNKLDQYGLVDYEMGFWESDIIDSLDTILKSVRAAEAAAAAAASLD
ncbi:hypothetical protein EV175_003292 [Coemansia sp. RSA 1933]|nr:hypothetical protein EV175_003292 [Coemansia sp. RSA 1933]